MYEWIFINVSLGFFDILVFIVYHLPLFFNLETCIVRIFLVTKQKLKIWKNPTSKPRFDQINAEFDKPLLVPLFIASFLNSRRQEILVQIEGEQNKNYI